MPYPGSPNDPNSRLGYLDASVYHISRRLDDDRRALEQDLAAIRGELKDLWAGLERQNRIREAILRRLFGYAIYLLVIVVAALVSAYFNENSPISNLLNLIV